IAKHAGISKGVISYHFAGKDELLHEVVVQVYTKVAEAVAPAIGAQSDAVGALRTHITAVAGYMREHRTELLALSSIFLGARGSEGEPRYGITGNEELYQGLEYIFRWGQEEGVFRDFDRRVMAVTFQAAVDAMFGYWVAYPEHDLEGHARELADLFENASRAGRWGLRAAARRDGPGPSAPEPRTGGAALTPARTSRAAARRRPREGAAVGRPTGHSHHRRRGGAGDRPPATGLERPVVRGEPQAAEPALGGDHLVRSAVVLRHPGERPDRMLPADPRRPADVLAVHDRLAEHRHDREGRLGPARDGAPEPLQRLGRRGAQLLG